MHHPKNVKDTGFIQLELEIEEYPLWPLVPIVENEDSEEDVERGVYIIDLM